MEKLNLLIVGDNDIAKLCHEETHSAGHDVIDQLNKNADADNKSLITVFCSQQNFSEAIASQSDISLIFNTNIMAALSDLLANSKNKQACIWYINSTSHNTLRPFLTDLNGLSTIDEVIRESFVEILSQISRNTLQINPAKIDYKQDISQISNLSEAFGDIAEKFSDHIALMYEDETLTYKQLYNLSSQVSDQISANSYSHKPVILYFKRNINMIIAMLGVLMSGNAYVPIDPKNPQSRAKLIFDDSKADLILCDDNTISDVKNIAATNILNIDWKKLNPEESIPQHSHQNEVAYIIYTSGSTGRPKGVMCTHKGGLNMVLWTINTYPITHQDRVIQLASYAFDISVWEIFSALLSGAALVLAKDDGYSDPNYIAKIIKQYSVTVAHMIPTILDLYLDEIKNHHENTLKQVVSGGEELRPAIADKFFSRLPHANLYHGYGPTECAITCVHHTVKPHTYQDFISIGSPIQHTNIYVLDDYLMPVAVGCEGELYVGGRGLSKGYLNNPGQTRERFMISPFNHEEVIYKTGDLVKKLNDSTLKYIGRVDNQIKIRGNRVELEEIERIVALQTSIKQCSVQLINITHPVLVAFCVFNEELISESEIEKLKKDLQSTLPNYMVPSYFLSMNELPRNVNGKIDKHFLQHHFINEVKQENNLTENHSDTEAKIIEFMNNVLRLRINDISEDLMALGINSISVIYLLNFIEKTFFVRLTPIEIFQLKSIKIIAFTVEQRAINRDRFIGQAIPRISRKITLPLSNAQARLWFLHQLEEQKSSAYNIFKVFELKNKPDFDKLETAFEKVIARHEPLRTLFQSVAGKPHQVICEPYSFHLSVISSHSDKIQYDLLQFGNDCFDLSSEFSLKAKVFYIEDENKYVLAILQHNIITDGWSTGILLNELTHYYSSDHALTELNIQLVDYAVWQSKRLTNEWLKSELDYWQGKLHRLSHLNFPLDYSRPARQTFTGKIQAIEINGENFNQIDQFIKQHKITLYTYLVSVLKVLIMRYADQNDIVIGTGYASRDKAELKDIMGFFINTIPLRTTFDNQDTFLDALAKCKQTILDAISHSEVPFDILVDKLNIEREPNLSPIFQMLFLMQDAADNITLNIEGEVKEWEIDLGISIFDMTFNIIKDNNKIIIALQYNTDLFKTESIIQFLRHYQQALSKFVTSPESRIKEVSIVNQHDLAMIASINPKNQHFPYLTILDKFNECVKAFPNNKALIEDISQELTYSELDQLSSKLSDQFAKICDENNIIAIYMHKSIAMIASMLAIIKSGNAYLLIDTETPDHRLQYILKNSGCRFAVYFDKKPKDNSSVKWMHYQDLISQQSETTHNKIASNSNCYVLYTSGSTGEPKGVQITHSNLINTLCSFIHKLNIQEDCKLLSLTSPSFDIFQLEAYLPLLSGGTCYIFTQPLNEYLNKISDLINTVKPTVIQATPSVWKLVLQSLQSTHPNTTILIGGETLDASLLKSLQNHFCQIYNVYGPTETTIWSTYAELNESNHIHIGKAIDNTTVFVVDKQNQLLPAACEGEMIIGGESVSIGYLNKPVETQAKFVELSFPELCIHKQRFYKTGDKAKMSHDGYIEYIGRDDDQVKVRGHRIELDEIVKVIKQHHSVKDVVVLPIARDNNRYDQILVAFIITNDLTWTQEQLTHEITQYTQHYLPIYMVPYVCIKVEQIPLNTNGKIDKFKLNVIYQNNQNKHTNQDKLEMTKIENEIFDIWSRTLKIHFSDLNTSFFYLGGSSLLIAEIVTAINNRYGSSITIRQFVNHPTIAALAALIEKNL